MKTYYNPETKIKILRFDYKEVMEDIDNVLKEIEGFISDYEKYTPPASRLSVTGSLVRGECLSHRIYKANMLCAYPITLVTSMIHNLSKFSQYED